MRTHIESARSIYLTSLTSLTSLTRLPR